MNTQLTFSSVEKFQNSRHWVCWFPLDGWRILETASVFALFGLLTNIQAGHPWKQRNISSIRQKAIWADSKDKLPFSVNSRLPALCLSLTAFYPFLTNFYQLFSLSHTHTSYFPNCYVIHKDIEISLLTITYLSWKVSDHPPEPGWNNAFHKGLHVMIQIGITRQVTVIFRGR